MKAYELLSSKEKWAQKCYAYSKNGVSCDPTSKGAYTFCIMGAIEACYYNKLEILGGDQYRENVAKVKKKVGNIPCWNDAKERTYEEVVAVLKELDI